MTTNIVETEQKHRRRNVTIVISVALAIVVFSISVLGISGSILPTSPANSRDFIHPEFSIPAVLSVISAYLFKRRGKERFVAHYIAGTAGVSLTVTAFLIALTDVGTYPRGTNHFLFTIAPHFLVAFIVLILVLIQGYTGLSMVLFGRSKNRIFNHEFLSKWVFIIYLIQGSLGLTILISLFVQ